MGVIAQPTAANAPDLQCDPGSLRILTWNIQMLPAVPYIEKLNRGQGMRAPWIVDFLNAQNYDIVVLQEVIDKPITELLKQRLKEKYPHQVSVEAKRGIAGCSGGILFVSRCPLKYVDHIVYQNLTGIDVLAEKGCVLVEGRHNGSRFQIAGTHLQAGDDGTREKEIPEIADLLATHRLEGVPLFLVGDMNLSPDEAVFAKLLEATETTAFPLHDPDPTTISPDNSWCGPNKRGCHIDHVLLSPRGTKTTITRQTIQRARRQHDGKWIDLSDHYGVVAEIHFQE
jgi:endonuclease/exonuclease/phosphatase family metal-dependent hydrolase